MTIHHRITKNSYYDSISLMIVNDAVSKFTGIESAFVGMATPYNIENLKRLKLHDPAFDALTPNDLIICVEAKDGNSAEGAFADALTKLTKKRADRTNSSEHVISSQEAAGKLSPSSNVVIISVPGAFAAYEAERAILANRHVMIFSDNVTLEDELHLKRLASERGLLVMGPDCGTAIINGVGLAFANCVRRGSIGIVGASGTGMQEISTTIHRLGFGVSQAIGVGGRDLSETIGGIMTIDACEALGRDPMTKAIVVVSKPPAKKILPAIFEKLSAIQKPMVIYFIGEDPFIIEEAGFKSAIHLEEAAIEACSIISEDPIPRLMNEEKFDELISENSFTGSLRGLYSGGTLCDEAQRLLLADLKKINSNVPIAGVKKLKDSLVAEGHTIIDLGDDEFTRGRPHPMIDPTLRCEMIKRESEKTDVGAIIFDIVLGYGSHPDMAGAIAKAITATRGTNGKKPLYAASICGTDLDPQNYDEQRAKLEGVGVKVFPTNALLVEFIRGTYRAGS